ncbi:MAG: RsiV family protein [Bacteroidota bacterium]
MRSLLPCLFLLLLIGCADQNSTPEKEEAPAEPTIEFITATDAAVPLSALTIVDSVALFPGDSLTPRGVISIRTVVPHAENQRLNRKINRSLGRLIAGDDYPMVPTNPRQHLEQATRNMLLVYGSLRTDTTTVRASPQDYNFVNEYTTHILHNDHDVLALAISQHSDYGEGQENYYTHFFNFDATTGRQLGLNDVFVPEGRVATGKLLQDYFSVMLDGGMKTEITEPTENFAITPKGIVFNYPPYEIAPYPIGQQEATLSYEQLRDHLTDRGKSIAASLQAG